MISWVVADSGLYLAIALKESFADKVAALIGAWQKEAYQVAVPYLFRYELVAVVRKHVARGNMSLDDGAALLRGLLKYPVETFNDEGLLTRAFEVAAKFHRPTAYDSFYLALAEQLNCEFWTADLKLFNAVRNEASYVKWIGDFIPVN